MKSATDNTYKKGQIRRDNIEQIIKAAANEFSNKGYDGTSMKSIAKSAGMTRPKVHYYFNDKEEVYQSTLQYISEKWADATTVINFDADPFNTLQKYIHQQVRLAFHCPEFSKIAVLDNITNKSNAFFSHNKEAKEQIDSLVSAIEHWIEKGLIRDTNPIRLLFAIWSMTSWYSVNKEQALYFENRTKFQESDIELISMDISNLILPSLVVT
ncbi:transcriptional regulator, TetR family [Paraglaciecola sp. T6c]|uniref:TetR/AcrR family transcriptional regulator n=1 Tax=Pseudoalteromonas atlantica (strain T6c / ATCC BAA-1087) TaxID=3042615 RepID=UPI00005C6FC5|nr:TetR/AcrR family transcriptional regulator [Paraglaciecola sp. T6c]ABG42405.1 transcriptional regulator, TetR family [Paraglaciecola sp. T6c]